MLPPQTHLRSHKNNSEHVSCNTPTGLTRSTHFYFIRRDESEKETEKQRKGGRNKTTQRRRLGFPCSLIKAMTQAQGVIHMCGHILSWAHTFWLCLVFILRQQTNSKNRAVGLHLLFFCFLIQVSFIYPHYSLSTVYLPNIRENFSLHLVLNKSVKLWTLDLITWRHWFYCLPSRFISPRLAIIKKTFLIHKGDVMGESNHTSVFIKQWYIDLHLSHRTSVSVYQEVSLACFLQLVGIKNTISCFDKIWTHLH